MQDAKGRDTLLFVKLQQLNTKITLTFLFSIPIISRHRKTLMETVEPCEIYREPGRVETW